MMMFDIGLRLNKYYTFVQEVIAHGLNCEVLTGETDTDALVIWNASLPKPPRTGPGRCLIAFRKRGAFLLAGWSSVYLLPNTVVALEVSSSLASTMQLADYNATLADAVDRHELRPLSMSTFHQADFEEQRITWKECGWFDLPPVEEAQVWGRFKDHILGPSGDLNPPAPVMTWVIPDRSDVSNNAEGLLTQAVFDALRGCAAEGQYVLALDWEHPCYRFFPHHGNRTPYRDYWAIPVWPRGGSYYFLAPDFEYGVLASHSGQLYIFGQTLIAASYGAVTNAIGPPNS